MLAASRTLLTCVVLITSYYFIEARPAQENAFDKIAKIDAKYKESTDSKHEVDMILPKVKTKRVRRGLGQTVDYQTVKLWPNGIIPYTISYGLLHEQGLYTKLMDAMYEWQNKTCIKFRKRVAETNYVYFYNGKGCVSDVGLKKIGRQQVSLGKGCHAREIIVHELGHTIGLCHEQNRPDRDKYVEVLFDNILPEYRFSYKVKSECHPDSINSPYDYYSIMHYGNKAFTLRNQVTMRAYKPGVTYFGGSQVSGLDAIRVRKMYKCKDYPAFPKDFFWSHNNYGTARKTCIDIIEPDDAENSWDNNKLCYYNRGRRPLNIKWSYRGRIPGMSCTKVSYARKLSNPSWNDNFICVPKYAPYKFKWVNGRMSWAKRRKDCVKINEPHDKQWNRAYHYLCATERETDPIDGKWSEWSDWSACGVKCGGGFQSRQRVCSPRANGGKSCPGKDMETRTCNTQKCNALPSFPKDFKFFHTEPFQLPSSGNCLRTYDYKSMMLWMDYYFCSSDSKTNPNITWSMSRPISGMRCTRINNPQEYGWKTNYICVPQSSPYRFKWSLVGPIPGMDCLQWYAQEGQRGWDKTYLCNENQDTAIEALR